MRIFSPLILSIILAFPVHANDSPLQNTYMRATAFLRTGKIAEGIALLKNAAAKGSIAAMSLLAKLYEEGNGVDISLEKSFALHQQIITLSEEFKIEAGEMPLIVASYVRLGKFYLAGVVENNLPPNIMMSYNMFHYAAVNYSSAEAQFNLGKMLLEGVGSLKKDPKQAARWLVLAAASSHPGAQALLGILLYEGKDTPRQPALGLMYLTLAVDSASPSDRWIREKYNEAMANASDEERAQALKLVEKWVAKER